MRNKSSLKSGKQFPFEIGKPLPRRAGSISQFLSYHKHCPKRIGLANARPEENKAQATRFKKLPRGSAGGQRHRRGSPS